MKYKFLSQLFTPPHFGGSASCNRMYHAQFFFLKFLHRIIWKGLSLQLLPPTYTTGVHRLLKNFIILGVKFSLITCITYYVK